MTILIFGLIIFLGIHSVRMAAPSWREGMIARAGQNTWKLGYSALSLAGLALIVWGYGAARQASVVLYNAPPGMRHAAALLTLIAFILIAAAYVPRNHLKARFHHPMVLGVKAWALAHLLANGMLADVLLFGSFLGWAVWSFIAARKRDRAAGTVYQPGTLPGSLGAIVAGIVAWFAFAFWLHGPLIGVLPLGAAS